MTTFSETDQRKKNFSEADPAGTHRFSGLRSRWTTSLLWRYCTPFCQRRSRREDEVSDGNGLDV